MNDWTFNVALTPVDADRFVAAVKSVCGAAAKGAAAKSRPVLGLVEITVLPGELKMVATDSYLATQVFFADPTFEATGDAVGQKLLVSAADLLAALPPKAEYKKPAGEDASVKTLMLSAVGGKFAGVALTTDETRIAHAVTDVEYPKTDSFFTPKEYDVKTLSEPRMYDAARLGQAAKIVGAVGKDVRVDMIPGSSPMAPTVFAGSVPGTSVTVVLMPMRR